MYKIHNDGDGKQNGIQRIADKAFIPMNPDNTDYQQYLKWLDEGNSPAQPDVEVVPTSPLPADEQGAA